ncbi:hypothetical protein X797_010872 [Metarhizium robertsii]|uniref:Uncharacterized protein n=1 Tax=Metarhizium robertsii TaxID=568076 RepID=A0A014PJS5_9HYPO|nr:hypothetical protein X797_010872 [Metarhizium robertsii]
MEWLHQNTLLGDEDLNVFRFKPGECIILELSRQLDRQSSSRSRVLKSEEDWKAWLKQAASAKVEKKRHGTTVLLAKRVTNKPHDGMVVSHLPVPQSMFGSIINAFSIHRSISRVINRNTSAVFSAQSVKDRQTGNSRLVYNCRSSASYPDDLALSVTFCTKIRSTQAVFYGCSEERIRIITRRLETSDCAVFHPLTLPTIFAEIERDRQIQMVEKALNKLITRVLNVVNHPLRFYSTSPCEKSGISQGSDDSNSIELWLNISHIKNGLETWRQQLLEMLTHADMLSEKYFSSGAGDTNEATVANIATVMPCQQTTDDKLMNGVGKRIKYRLRELVCIMDGMTLATQMEWSKIAQLDAKTTIDISHSALEIAKAARYDGIQMKSIAILTMIFLPATFVAILLKTLFSMTFFNWNHDADKSTVSPYIWVYVFYTFRLRAPGHIYVARGLRRPTRVELLRMAVVSGHKGPMRIVSQEPTRQMTPC